MTLRQSQKWDDEFRRMWDKAVLDACGAHPLDPLNYLTTAASLEGYAQGLIDKERHAGLINRLNKASELLKAVWTQFEHQLNVEKK
jgi:hypothetical protein